MTYCHYNIIKLTRSKQTSNVILGYWYQYCDRMYRYCNYCDCKYL